MNIDCCYWVSDDTLHLVILSFEIYSTVVFLMCTQPLIDHHLIKNSMSYHLTKYNTHKKGYHLTKYNTHKKVYIFKMVYIRTMDAYLSYHKSMDNLFCLVKRKNDKNDVNSEITIHS